MRAAKWILVGVMTVGLSACALDPQSNPKQTAGTVLGGVGGGLLGAQVGGGRGQLVATGAGAVLGAWLGSEVGASLDSADRMAAQQATYQALEYNPTGQTAQWNNPDSGRHGSVTPTRTYETAGQVCREYEHTVVIDGRREVAYGEACRDADGRWRII